MIRCVCGIDATACERDQRRAQSSEPCDDRRVYRCSRCGEEPDDHVLCDDCKRRETDPDYTCAICGAFDAGSQVDAYRRCVDCRVVFVYTDAPAAYDYWYTTQVNACAGTDTRGKAWRCVRMAEDRVEAQSARYRSGWHAAMPGRDWQKAIMSGVLVAPPSGGAS